MKIGVKEAKNKLPELVRRVEAGEEVTITRDGVPIADMIKHTPKKIGLNWEAVREYKRKHGIGEVVAWIAPDFDDPLPEDFLITLNAEEKYLEAKSQEKK